MINSHMAVGQNPWCTSLTRLFSLPILVGYDPPLMATHGHMNHLQVMPTVTLVKPPLPGAFTVTEDSARVSVSIF